MGKNAQLCFSFPLAQSGNIATFPFSEWEIFMMAHYSSCCNPGGAVGLWRKKGTHNTVCAWLTRQSQRFGYQLHYKSFNSCDLKISAIMCTSPTFIVHIALKRASDADLAIYTDDTWVYLSQEDWTAWDRKALEEDPHNYLHPFCTAMEAFESSQRAIFSILVLSSTSSWWEFVQCSLSRREGCMKWTNLQAKTFNKDRVVNRNLII